MQKFLIAIIIFTLQYSCTTNTKFSFKTAYKFKYLHFEQEVPKDSFPVLIVSARGSDSGLKDYKYSKPDKILKLSREPVKIAEGDLHKPTVILQDHHNWPHRNFIPFQGVLHKDRDGDKFKRNHHSGFRDLHPALQGFIFVAFGFGLVLIGSLFETVPILATILVILGFVIVAYGFYKILTKI